MIFPWAMGYFLLSLFSVGYNYAPSILAFCLGTAILSAMAYKKGLRIKTSHRVILLGLGLGVFYGHFTTWQGVEAGANLLGLLAAVKSLELRTKRDYGLFLFIVQLMLVTHFLLLESLLYLVVVVASSVVLFFLLILLDRDGRPLPRHLVGGYARWCAISLATGSILFFLFPRLYIPFFNIRSVGENPATGFTRELRVGEIAKLHENDEPVFRATFMGEIPPREKLYWRGEILNHTDGMNWVRKNQGRTGEHILREETLYEYTVALEDQGAGHLFNLSGVRNLSPLVPFHILETGQGIYRAMPLSKKPFSYRAQTAEVEYVRPLATRARERYLQLPESVDPRVRALAKRMGGEGREMGEKLALLVEFFRDNGFDYTYEPGIYARERFLGEFLFERKKGFCGHLASALGLLMRQMGIPARVVVGFQGGVINPYGQELLLRGADAHAWVEYWEEGAGWRLLDATATVAPGRITQDSLDYFAEIKGARGEVSALGTLYRRVSFHVKALYYGANTFFLHFDRDAQRAFWRNLFGVMPNPWIMALTAVVASLILILWGGVGRRIPCPHQRAYGALLKKLKKRGIPVTPHHGPLEVRALVLGTLERREGLILAQKINRYIRARYGERG